MVGLLIQIMKFWDFELVISPFCNSENPKRSVPVLLLDISAK